MQNYTGGFEFHPKVSPFPLGLKPKMGKAAYRNPVPFFRQVFLETWNGNHNETEFQQKKITTFLWDILLTRVIKGQISLQDES